MHHGTGCLVKLTTHPWFDIFFAPRPPLVISLWDGTWARLIRPFSMCGWKVVNLCVGPTVGIIPVLEPGCSGQLDPIFSSSVTVLIVARQRIHFRTSSPIYENLWVSLVLGGSFSSIIRGFEPPLAHPRTPTGLVLRPAWWYATPSLWVSRPVNFWDLAMGIWI